MDSMILDTSNKPGCKYSYEVLNKYFGMNYHGFMGGFLYLDKKETIGVWFPKFYEKRKGGWTNEISEDGSEIHMYRDEKGRNRGNSLHIAFAKLTKKSDYTFVGVFRRDFTKSTPLDNYLYLVSNTIDVSLWANGGSVVRFDEKYLLNPVNHDDEKLIEDIDRAFSVQLNGEVKKSIVKVRCNQSVFRERLQSRYRKCCLCNVSNNNLLIASHIKPWSESGGKEKLDVNNGFLLCPNHDKLFDQGWISFEDSGNIIISDKLSDVDRLFMNVNNDMSIEIVPENIKYIKYHRENIFIK